MTWSSLRSSPCRLLLTLTACVIDVLQQRIDGGTAPGCIGTVPPIRAEPCTRLPFGLVSQVMHRLVDNRDACARGDGLPVAQDTRRPSIVALEHSRCGKGYQGVDERELVVELADAGKALAHQGDRLI